MILITRINPNYAKDYKSSMSYQTSFLLILAL